MKSLRQITPSKIRKKKSQVSKQTMKKSLEVLSSINPKWGADLGLEVFMTPLVRRKKKNPPPGTRIEYLKSGGNRLKTYRYGSSLKKILFVHGWEGAASDFFEFFPALSAEGFEVVAIDLPGHGQSSMGQLNATMMVQIVNDVEVQIGPLSGFVGHSFGAFSLGHVLSQNNSYRNLPFISMASPIRLEKILEGYVELLSFSELQKQYFFSKVENQFQIKIKQFTLENFIRSHQGPTLLIHDQKDPVIPFSEISTLKKNQIAQEYLFTEGLGHNRLLKGKKVIEKSLTFLKKFHAPELMWENTIKFGL